MTRFPFGLSSRFRYQDLTFLKTLLGAVRLLYSPESSLHTELVQLPVVHMMLTQHSLFLPTMLTSEEQENLDSQVKGVSTLCPPSSVAAALFCFLPASHAPFVVFRVQYWSLCVCQIQGPDMLLCLKSDTEVAPCFDECLVYRGSVGAHVALSGAGVKSLGVRGGMGK